MDYLQSLLNPSSTIIPNQYTPIHPYYPTDLNLDYEPNTPSLSSLIIQFSLLLSIPLAAATYLTYRHSPNTPTTRYALILWFTLSGTLHLFFEGYLVTSHFIHLSTSNPDLYSIYTTISSNLLSKIPTTPTGPLTTLLLRSLQQLASLVFTTTRPILTYLFNDPIPSSTSLPAQLWKEYSLSDSRYLLPHPFILPIETLTVLILGPLCLVTAYKTAQSKPSRYILQFSVSLMHLYGVAMYFLTALYEEYIEDKGSCRPEWVYWWVYFWGMNVVWVVVPVWIVWNCIGRINGVIGQIEKLEKVYGDRNGSNSVGKSCSPGSLQGSHLGDSLNL